MPQRPNWVPQALDPIRVSHRVSVQYNPIFNHFSAFVKKVVHSPTSKRTSVFVHKFQEHYVGRVLLAFDLPLSTLSKLILIVAEGNPLPLGHSASNP